MVRLFLVITILLTTSFSSYACANIADMGRSNGESVAVTTADGDVVDVPNI